MDEKFNYGDISSCAPEDCASCGGCSDLNYDQAHRTITLTLDDDSEIVCHIITVFPVKDKEYIALLPMNPDGSNSDGEVYLYQFSVTDQGDPMLDNIEDEDEYALAAKAFEYYMTSASLDEAAGKPLDED